MNDYNFGNFLCMLREKNGMTQSDVASRLGVTPAAVSKWENGSSKPRVEVLFQLAGLLGVRAEELMCGHYIPTETIAPEVIKQINERYAYLMRVDAYNTSGVKWRRLLAWVMDWNIIGFTVMLLLYTFSAVMNSISRFGTQGTLLIMMLIVLMYPVGFVFRDFIFAGRSLGKRMLGLMVIDRETGEQAKASKCALRSIFLFILPLDAVIMLVSGMTLGDRAAHTVVVRKKVAHYADNVYQIDEINKYDAPKTPNTKRTALIVVLAVILAMAVFVSIVQVALSASRKTEEYMVAYSYFTESLAFRKLGVDESKIRHNSYTLTKADGVAQTAEIGFSVKGRSYTVICHKYNGTWVVCEECTVCD